MNLLPKPLITVVSLLQVLTLELPHIILQGIVSLEFSPFRGRLLPGEDRVQEQEFLAEFVLLAEEDDAGGLDGVHLETDVGQHVLDGLFLAF